MVQFWALGFIRARSITFVLVHLFPVCLFKRARRSHDHLRGVGYNEMLERLILPKPKHHLMNFGDHVQLLAQRCATRVSRENSLPNVVSVDTGGVRTSRLFFTCYGIDSMIFVFVLVSRSLVCWELGHAGVVSPLLLIAPCLRSSCG
jgi:hypothetical protein